MSALSRKRIKATKVSTRRHRLFRPDCGLLEDRRLLSVTLSAGGPTVPLVGSPVTWTASASGDGPAPVYQFRVGPVGGPTQVMQDFSTSNTVTWNPMQQGSYDIQVNVKTGLSASIVDSGT